MTTWIVAHQAALSMRFSRQEYWSGLPFPSPENLPHPGTELVSLTSPALAGEFFTTSATWETPNFHWLSILHMVMYMFQCYFPKSSTPLLPLPCPKCPCVLCCPARRIFSTIFLDSIYICVNMWYLSFLLWLTSLCIIGSKFIYLTRTESNAFLFIAEYYPLVYMYQHFLIHSSVDGHLGASMSLLL